MKVFKKEVPQGFTDPTAVPRSHDEALSWQRTNSSWWEQNPMRYDWKGKIPYPEFSKEFFEEIDARFFENAKEYMRGDQNPFSSLIGLSKLKNKNVLEIGVGNGSHAQLLARHAESFTGIDLTEYAVASTTARMKEFGIKATILKMDAEHMAFPDDSFDMVWSWGVIHHSANTQNIIREIHRVLKPGGEAIIMVYHRGWWNYYVTGVVQGIYSGSLLRLKSLNKSIQCHTDGGLARYYTLADWKKMAHGMFKIEESAIYGPKSDVMLLPGGKIKSAVMRWFPVAINKLCTTTLRMGSFFVVRMKKI